MAQSMRQVKKRIIATKKTSQITKAMHMISASKLRGAERQIKDYRPFMKKVNDIISNLVSSGEDLQHPLLEVRPIKAVCYVVITSDRGLAGGFNSNVFKEFSKLVSEHKSKDEFFVYPIGIKAFQFTKKKHYHFIQNRIVPLRDDIEFNEVVEAVRQIILGYVTAKFDKVVVIYNHHVNTLIQTVEQVEILPLKPQKTTDLKMLYEFSGGVEEILDTILPIYIENSIYGFILDSKASEHAARMNAMKSASDNAMEVIDSLELLYNRARQAAITLEITDIIGGASVVNES